MTHPIITGDPAVDAALATDLTIDITTTGRKSGEPKRIEIWFLNIDNRIFITGTPGPRDWYANLLSDGSMTFHLKESAQADLAAHASPVTDPDTRRMVLTHMVAQWYRQQVDVGTLIDSAPMVEVSFVDPT